MIEFAEFAAVAKLGPVMGKCRQEDLKVEMKRPAIRPMLALAYRIVITPNKAAQ